MEKLSRVSLAGRSLKPPSTARLLDTIKKVFQIHKIMIQGT